VLVRVAAEVHQPVEKVEGLLEASPRRWLPLEPGRTPEAPLILDLGLRVDGHRLSRHVALTIGGSLRYGPGLRILITWSDLSRPRLFPVLDGEIEINALGPDTTELAVRASYKPPFGAVGAKLDRAAMHHIAEASVTDFLLRTVNRVQEALGDDSGPSVPFPP
jgi:hypothetical protein